MTTASAKAPAGATIGIDASNLRGGGGITHLVNLLLECRPTRDGVDRVVVWAPPATLDAVPSRTFIDKAGHPLLGSGPFGRWVFQRRVLPELALRAGCDVLFCPGGTVPGRIRVPTVTMYRNSLTFQGEELRRFRPWSVSRFKLEILRRLQRRSLAAADGVIVLSNHAMELVRKQGIHHEMVRIPHGVQDRFRAPPAGARSQFGRRILYVSSVAAYKHQWNVVEAVALLRTRGHDVTLRIVGPVIDRASARRMKAALNRFDASGEWASFEGPADYERLHEEYGAADIFVFASTCENMPNTLLEAMASGLPIVSSASGPMPEIAIDSVLYADPEDPVSLAVRLAEILTNPDLAAELRRKAQERAEDFTWSRTAAETFRYLVEIAEASTASGAAPR